MWEKGKKTPNYQPQVTEQTEVDVLFDNKSSSSLEPQNSQ